MKFKEIIKNFVQLAKSEICCLEKYNILGEERKIRLDKTMKDWCEHLINGSNLNLFVKWVIKTFIIKNIPDITQAIFDLIKARIDGITEKTA